MIKSILRAILRILDFQKKAEKVNLILFGPPGSGKGTQAKKLEDQFDLMQISTGDLFRYESENTLLGKKAQEFMDAGKLVPDEITISMLKNKIAQYPECAGFIFDGYPRTIAQADALKSLLQSMNQKITALISLEVKEEEIVRRLLIRGETSGRADDANEEVIRKRLDVYKTETSPVFSYYDIKGLARKISGMGTIKDTNFRLNRLISAFFQS